MDVIRYERRRRIETNFAVITIKFEFRFEFNTE